MESTPYGDVDGVLRCEVLSKLYREYVVELGKNTCM
jgi:hypothetical protein